MLSVVCLDVRGGSVPGLFWGVLLSFSPMVGQQMPSTNLKLTSASPKQGSQRTLPQASLHHNDGRRKHSTSA